MGFKQAFVVSLALAVTLAVVSTTAAALEAAKDPQLTLTNGSNVSTFTRRQLLARPDVQELQVAQDPAYGNKPMTYRAVPAAALFADLKLKQDAVIEFRCLDGFSAPIDQSRVLNTNPARSVAYVAIEDKPWPALKDQGPSAGPFYLVWKNPERSQIAQEEWPFQLAAFAVKGTFADLYPKAVPVAGAPAVVTHGFAVFTKNCFACHTINKVGTSELGPDLNLPMSPSEYLTPGAFKTLVRNPQDLRYFPKSRMSHFSKEVLSDSDLDALAAYLKYMAKHRAS